MTVAYFLELDAAAVNAAQVRQAANAFALCSRIERLRTFDMFDPVAAHDPLLDDGAGPPIVAQLRFADAHALHKAIASAQMQAVFARLFKIDARLYQEALTIETYPVAGAAAAGEVAYLVNYHRPAADEAAFIAHYRANHPPIMLQFPGLHSLELGVPLDWTPAPDIQRADRMLYCEVSFASPEALNKALASEVRQTLRRDYEAFPPFSGPVSHYAMRRTRLLG